MARMAPLELRQLSCLLTGDPSSKGREWWGACGEGAGGGGGPKLKPLIQTHKGNM